MPPDEQGAWVDAAHVVKLAEIALDAYMGHQYDLFVRLMEELGDSAPSYLLKMAKMVARDEVAK